MPSPTAGLRNKQEATLSIPICNHSAKKSPANGEALVKLGLDIQVFNGSGMLVNEVTARLYVIAH